jgi:hypothetical protein
MLLRTVVKGALGCVVEGLKGVGNCFMLPASVGVAAGNALSPVGPVDHERGSYFVGDESGECQPGERLLPD